MGGSSVPPPHQPLNTAWRTLSYSNLLLALAPNLPSNTQFGASLCITDITVHANKTNYKLSDFDISHGDGKPNITTALLWWWLHQDNSRVSGHPVTHGGLASCRDAPPSRPEGARTLYFQRAPRDIPRRGRVDGSTQRN